MTFRFNNNNNREPSFLFQRISIFSALTRSCSTTVSLATRSDQFSFSFTFNFAFNPQDLYTRAYNNNNNNNNNAQLNTSAGFKGPLRGGEIEEKEKEGRGKGRKKRDKKDGETLPNKFLITVLKDTSTAEAGRVKES